MLTDDEPERVRENRRARGRGGSAWSPRAWRSALAGPRHRPARVRRATRRPTPSPRRAADLPRGRRAPDDDPRPRPAGASSPTATRSRSPTASAWRCSTAAGARWPAGILERALARFDDAPGRRGRARDRRLLLRGRRRRCSRRSPDLDGVADGPHARPARGDRGASSRRRRQRRSSTSTAAPSCQPGAVLLPPPRPRRDRPPGRAWWSLDALMPTRIRAQPRARPRARSAPRSRSWRRQVRRRRRAAGAGRGRHRAGGREPRAGADRQAGGAGDLFTWDFIGALQSRKVKDIAPRVRLIHSVASESALQQARADHPGARGADPGQRRGGGGQGRDRARGARRLHRSAAPCPVTGLMTMPPFVERSRGQPAATSPAWPSWRPSTASRACRWAPARTTPSPRRRARRSCAWAASSTSSRPAPGTRRSRPRAARPARRAATGPRPRRPARHAAAARAYSSAIAKRVQLVGLVAGGDDQRRARRAPPAAPGRATPASASTTRSASATACGCTWRSMRWRVASRAISRQRSGSSPGSATSTKASTPPRSSSSRHPLPVLLADRRRCAPRRRRPA